MDDLFGIRITQARLARGWDQAAVAQRLGSVAQQTVSRWERGASRPSRTSVAALADLFALDVDELLELTGHAGPVADKPSEAWQPRLLTLPLAQRNEEVFEQFTADLARCLYPKAKVSRYGRRGDKQGGIDVLVVHPTGRRTGIQCKRQKEFGPKKVRNAVEALSVEVDECFILLSRPASPQAREEILKHESWELWDVDDISRTVRMLPNLGQAVRLVDTYFPGQREQLLGVRTPSPWLTTEEYFRPLGGDRIFSHEWGLVGRTVQLEELRQHLAESPSGVVQVVGRGGIGKTRLLRELCADPESSDAQAVRFLGPDTRVEPQHFELLPTDDELVVVIDDAHGRDDNAAIISGIRRHRPDAKVVLALRPHGKAQLEIDLRRVSLYPAEVPSVVLNDLDIASAEALAQAVLGHNDHRITSKLAAVAADCPLLIVVGATLINRGHLDPSQIDTDGSIQTVIMGAFKDAIIAQPGNGNSEVREQVLRAIAALQPVRISESSFQDVLAQLAERPFDQVMPYLESMEEAGVVLRRGTSLRIIPDLLGDLLLTEAEIGRGAGLSTGYLRRVQAAANGGMPSYHLLVNACRIDWRIRRGSSAGLVVEPLWESLKDELQNADPAEQVVLLEIMGKAAAFQPRLALRTAHWVAEHVDSTAADARNAAVSDVLWVGPAEVKRQLVPLLKNVAYSLEDLPEAADLLWELARDDERLVDHYSDHPVRALTDIAEYHVGKPTAYQRALIGAVKGWLQTDVGRVHRYSPLDVLKPIFAPEVTEYVWQGDNLTLRTYPVNFDAVQDLRRQVLDLAFAEAHADDPRRAVEAVKVIEKSLHRRYSMSAQLDETPWMHEAVETVTRLGTLVTDTDRDPIVSYAVRRAVSWHARRANDQVKAAALGTLSRIPDSIDHQLTWVLHNGWDQLYLHSDSTFQASQAAREALFSTVADAVLSAWSPLEAVDRISRRLEVDGSTYETDTGAAVPFIWTLTTKNPDIADEICQRVISEPTSELRTVVAVALGRLAEVRPAVALSRARGLCGLDDTDMTRRVAGALAQMRGDRTALIDGEVDLLHRFVQDPDPHVRCLAIQAARRVCDTEALLAIDLVTAVRFADSKEVTEDVMAALGPQGFLSWEQLTDGQTDSIFRQLHECAVIDGYHTGVLFSTICKTHPARIVQLLSDRVERYEKNRQSRRGYRPLPYDWHVTLEFQKGQGFQILLRRVLDWVAGIDTPLRRRYGPALFSIVAGQFNDHVLQVIREAIDLGDTAHLRAAASVLAKAPRELLWTNIPFVTFTLHAAQRHGDDHVREVRSNFHNALLEGTRIGIPGQPYDEDIEQRDQATAIAERLPAGSAEQRFYRDLAQSAERNIQWEVDCDTALPDRRDW